MYIYTGDSLSPKVLICGLEVSAITFTFGLSPSCGLNSITATFIPGLLGFK